MKKKKKRVPGLTLSESDLAVAHYDAAADSRARASLRSRIVSRPRGSVKRRYEKKLGRCLTSRGNAGLKRGHDDNRKLVCPSIG